VTLTYKGQARPLVRKGAPQRQHNKFQTQTLEKEAISGQMPTKWAQHQDILTVSRKVTLTLTLTLMIAHKEKKKPHTNCYRCPSDQININVKIKNPMVQTQLASINGESNLELTAHEVTD
jgi:hypothetical protein